MNQITTRPKARSITITTVKAALTILSIFVVLIGHAQTHVTKDAKGNYVVARRSDTAANKATGHTITDRDGKTYPVFVSARGKLFYNRVSRSGNTYKCYLKEN